MSIPEQMLAAFALCLVLAPIEVCLPAGQGPPWSGRARNAAMTCVVLIIGGLATRWIYRVIPSQRSIEGHGWAASLLLGIASAVLTDVLFYWYHRGEHRFRLLWAIHELHHSDAELNATTSMRSSWLELPLQALCIGIPVGYVAGLDHTAAALSSLVLTAWFFLAHANLRLRLGFATPIICGPQVHRIHHSRLPEHRDKNFAQFFPFIDMLFGTYYAPARDEFPATGTPELASDAPFMELLMRPFRLWATSLHALLRR
jgi:sterol desaturase/sphingolipid hydroxylase (fatty acid hydroxylase superfamily)